MAARAASSPNLEFYPLTPDRWPDLEALFGPRGAVGGCWSPKGRAVCCGRRG